MKKKSYKPPWLEISTQLPCCNNCSYCPQGKLMEIYTGEKTLSLRNFKILIRNIPRTVILSFAAFNEPFQNEECADMMLYAHKAGFDLAVWTTLIGLRDEDVEKIKNIPFIVFSIHDIGQKKKEMPFEITDWHKVNKIISRGSNLYKIKRKEKVSGCQRGPYNHNVVLPNGDVCLCCNDWGLDHVLGNLFEKNYNDIKKDGPFELCHYCEYAI